MKKYTTQKYIKALYKYIIKVPYCRLQYLLAFENPIYYHANGLGWRADIYQITEDIAICTGYAPYGNICPDYEILREFDEKAAAVLGNYELDYQQRRDRLQYLINMFIDNVVFGITYPTIQK